MTTLRHGSATDVGRVRTVNEDRALEGPALFAVADGMGGHAAGEVAARVSLDVLKESFDHDPSEVGLLQGVRNANRAVWDMAQADVSLRGMGTTLTIGAFLASGADECFAVVNVGDSRAYLYHSGDFLQLTLDHSVAEEMMRRGELSMEEALVHPHRHILTRALGVAPTVEIDGWRVFARGGDRLLLCSDGLTNEVSDADIARVLARREDPSAAASELVALANSHGGNDNVTVVIIDVLPTGNGSGALQEEASEQAALPLVVPIEGLKVPPAVAKRRSAALAAAIQRASSAASVTRNSRPSAPPSDSAAAGEASAAKVPGIASAVASSPSVEEKGGATAMEGTQEPSQKEVLSGLPASRTRPARAGRETTRRLTRGSETKTGKHFTLRVLAFFIVLAVILAGAVGVVYWYAQHSYYVGLRGNQVAIFQGRPGGLFGIKPKLVQLTDLTTATVVAVRIRDLTKGMKEPSIAAARRYVANLRQEYKSTVSAHTHKKPTASRTSTSTSTSPSGSTGPGTSTGAGTTYQRPSYLGLGTGRSGNVRSRIGRTVWASIAVMS